MYQASMNLFHIFFFLAVILTGVSVPYTFEALAIIALSRQRFWNFLLNIID